MGVGVGTGVIAGVGDGEFTGEGVIKETASGVGEAEGNVKTVLGLGTSGDGENEDILGDSRRTSGLVAGLVMAGEGRLARGFFLTVEESFGLDAASPLFEEDGFEGEGLGEIPAIGI